MFWNWLCKHCCYHKIILKKADIPQQRIITSHSFSTPKLPPLLETECTETDFNSPLFPSQGRSHPGSWRLHLGKQFSLVLCLPQESTQTSSAAPAASQKCSLVGQLSTGHLGSLEVFKTRLNKVPSNLVWHRAQEEVLSWVTPLFYTSKCDKVVYPQWLTLEKNNNHANPPKNTPRSPIFLEVVSLNSPPALELQSAVDISNLVCVKDLTTKMLFTGVSPLNKNHLPLPLITDPLLSSLRLQMRWLLLPLNFFASWF